MKNIRINRIDQSSEFEWTFQTLSQFRKSFRIFTSFFSQFASLFCRSLFFNFILYFSTFSLNCLVWAGGGGGVVSLTWKLYLVPSPLTLQSLLPGTGIVHLLSYVRLALLINFQKNVKLYRYRIWIKNSFATKGF